MAILTVPSDHDLAAFVDAYALGALKTARGIEAGTVNTSYALELDAGRFFLRIYEEQDAQGAAREARVLAHLAGQGVPTPAPVVAKDGAPTRTVAGKPAANVQHEEVYNQDSYSKTVEEVVQHLLGCCSVLRL
jgi:homoserine kinase type II